MGAPETVTYKTANGCAIKLDVFPVETASVPVLVLIHGGALIGGSRTQMQPVLRELLTERGYA